MTTVSDAFTETAAAAVPGGNPTSETDTPPARHTYDARARVAVTESAGKRLASDVANAWVWRDAPPSIQEIIAGRDRTSERGPLGAVWAVVVAAPTSAVLYVLAWLLQHPGRTALVAVVAGSITVMWIKH